ncbi:MAG: c-type cytochrome biogenesis protein CcsB [Nitrospirae bacterium]|nr:c-type cytochrome biogenesis protein CcsB [Nitrospirota bacterium]
MTTLLFELALTFYFAAAIVSLSELFRESKGASKMMFAFAFAGFALHTVGVAARYISTGQIPITSMHEASSFFAWCVMLVFLIISRKYKIGIMASFTMPVIFLLMLSASIMPREATPLSPTLKSYWLAIHTLLAFLGNAAFAVAFGAGIMYLIQDANLKSKRLNGIFQRLPSVQTLDDMNYRLISAGFPLLTLAIITGALWAESAWGSYWRWDPKEVWSLIAWLIYAIVIHVRLVAGWRGKKAAMLSILGFLVLLFTFFGVNYFHNTLHRFP